MLKIKSILIFLILLNPFLFQKKAYANCNFKTGNFIKQLNTPNSIKEIDIDIVNSKNIQLIFIKLFIFINFKRKYWSKI